MQYYSIDFWLIRWKSGTLATKEPSRLRRLR